jgi:hypothetical protein
MAVRGRTIYYCAWDKGLKMINLSDKSVSDIINSSMSGVDYVATSGTSCDISPLDVYFLFQIELYIFN